MATKAERIAKKQRKEFDRLLYNTMVNLVGLLEMQDQPFTGVSVVVEVHNGGNAPDVVSRVNWKRL